MTFERNKLIHRRKTEGATYKKIASEFGISISRVEQIVKAELWKKKRRLQHQRFLFAYYCEEEDAEELSYEELRQLAWWNWQFKIWLPMMIKNEPPEECQ